MYRIPRNWTDGVEIDTPEPHCRGPRNPTAGDPGTGVPPNVIKNDTKNDIPPAGGFDEFWRAYPSRRPHSNPKAPAKKKYGAAIRRGVSPTDINRGAENYARHVEYERVEPRFVPMAQTWLSQERWSEYQEAVEPDSRPLML